MAFKRILCPVDFSACSRQAFEMAAQLARESGGVLLLAHIWEPSTWVMGDYTLAPEVIDGIIATAEGELAKWCGRAKELGVKEVDTRFLTGAPWDRIVGAARDDQAIDLVVMGTHGRTGLKHALLGSVAEKTVRHAPCPVLIVRARGAS